MTVVAGARKHGELAVNLLWEEHTVAIEGQEGVFALVKALEVEGISDANGGSVITIAPGNPIAVVDPSYARVVLILRFDHLGITSFEHDRFVVDVPVNTILAETGKDIHLHGFVIATENASEAVFKRYYGTIENAV